MENSDAPGVRGEPGGHRASERGRDSPDAHFFFADAFPFGLVPPGSGGGAFVGRPGEVDEDGDVICPGRGQASSIPGPESRADEGVGQGEVNGAGPKGA